MNTENRTRKCMNCAYGHAIVKGSMYCSHPFHYGASNEPNHHCLNWKDKRHGERTHESD